MSGSKPKKSWIQWMSSFFKTDEAAKEPVKKHEDRRKNPPRGFIFEEMEVRNLFSGGLEGVVATQIPSETTYTYQDIDDEKYQPKAKTTDASEADESRHELVFIDGGVEDYDTLVSDLLSAGTDTLTIDVFVIDPEANGIGQITDVLERYSNIDAIHILAHGEPAAIQLGDSKFTQSTMDKNPNMLDSWQSALNPDADILLYGCDLASTNQGRIFAHTIADATGADVSSSDDLTGNFAEGGDWHLEYTHGTVETETLQSANWAGTLAAPVANADSETVITGAPIVVDVLENDTDADGDPLTVTHIIDTADSNTEYALNTAGDSATLNSGTVITLRADGRLDVTAAADGVEAFDYRISDGASTSEATVSLTAASDEATAKSMGFIT